MSDVPTIHDYLNALRQGGPEAAAAAIARGRSHPTPEAKAAPAASAARSEQARQGAML